MTIRKLHRTIGLCFAPFFLLTAVTGAVLLWRHAGLYDINTTRKLLKLHNWEGLHAIGIHYLGTVLAAGLVMMVITGSALWFQILTSKRRRSS